MTVTSELPGEVRFQHDGTRFTSPGTAAYALAVDLAVVGDELTWAWHWAPTGRPPTMQSQLRATRTA